jgi:hypothetical protein
VEMSSKVPLSAAQWAHSSKRPNDLEIAAPDGFRSVSFPPLLGALCLGGRARFFAVLHAGSGAVPPCISCPKNPDQQRVF